MRSIWLAVLLLAVSGSVTAVERVVSLAPSLSEIVVELNSADLLVGVLDAGERPAELQGQLLLVTDKGLERPSGQMIEATAKLCQVIAPER
nr:hypothetical protein [Pseudomonas sp. QTF5]